MKSRLFACAVMLAAAPASAEDAVKGITLVHGHPIHHEAAKRAGVTMGVSISGKQPHTAPLVRLCDELRIAAGLRLKVRKEFTLQAVFVVPRKEMAVEGYYLPANGDPEFYALIPGMKVARAFLKDTLARAGMPPHILDEADVEHEISCHTDEPRWTMSWQDIRPVGDERPETVIERARERFMAVYRNILKRAQKPERHTKKSRRKLAERNR